MANDLNRVLVTVTGRDHPGITAALTGIIAGGGAALLDIEQVVIQGQLTLCLLVGVDPSSTRGAPVIKDLLFAAKELKMELDFQVLEREAPPDDGATRRTSYAVTIIGDAVDASAIHELANTLAKHGANIDTIRRLSDVTLSSVEIGLSIPPDEAVALALRKDLMEVSALAGIDVALQRETLTRRSKRLIVMDMDSTLIRVEVIDELARLHGVFDEVTAITARAMKGELVFEQSLVERCKLLKGLSVAAVMKIAADLPITEGAEDLLRVLRGLGYKTAVISGGFTFAADALRTRLGLDYAFANQLEIKDGKLTGRVLEPIVGPQRKADLLDTLAQREGVTLEQTIAIGDGANDLLMLEKAGLGIAFHAKPKLKAAADTSISAGGLDRILFLLGLRARDVREFLHDS